MARNITCRNKNCDKPFLWTVLPIHKDRKGSFVNCPFCGYDNTTPRVLFQMRMSYDEREILRETAQKYGFGKRKLVHFVRQAALNYIPKLGDTYKPK